MSGCLSVIVTLVPEYGDRRHLAKIDIFNTGEGTSSHGHYAVEGIDAGRALRRASIGLVKRSGTAPLALAARALHALGYVVREPPKDTDVGRCEERFREFIASRIPMTELEIEDAVAAVFGKQKRK